ncbi:MAG: glycosyltransferase [Deltaproteobacteria bacterium HGW-Deltaproteobacteria-2]|jgi:N-acetylglucosaminyldiphosphoundecaprenol N-acetyl-beta-D-mannosaminyltransferase|nr:MAG: glycosyltransferase [Deltaproteobacteria bacterium HGW-Deltaproteobacteria-2]
MKEEILGYKVNTFSADECADQLLQSLKAGERTWLACFNPHSYTVALKDKVFARALKDADWLVPDGAGVVLASRLLGGSINERVTGSDVFAGLNNRMNAAGSMRVYFLGSTEETLELIKQRMERDYPAIKVVGTFSPPFKDVYSSAEITEMVKAINTAAPDVLWVGLSAPKQERFIFENRARLNVNIVAAVGAVFDFYSGNIKRDKDSWFVNHGMEWLPRLLQEPGRLWRRMFVSAPVFVWHVVKQKVKGE